MAVKLKSKKQTMTVGSDKGKLCFQMSPQMYSRIMHDEIVAYAAKSAAVPESSIDVAMEALADAVAIYRIMLILLIVNSVIHSEI